MKKFNHELFLPVHLCQELDPAEVPPTLRYDTINKVYFRANDETLARLYASQLSYHIDTLGYYEDGTIIKFETKAEAAIFKLMLNWENKNVI